MKKIIVLVLCSLFLVPLKAVDYCAPSSWGYVGNVTGGGNATPTMVNSVSQLTSALGGSQKPKNKVVIITQDLTFTSMLTIQDAQNITIMALPGVKLISNQRTKNESGILFIKRTSNIILRNLTFIGPGAYDVNGNDNLCFENVTSAWVDHCDFQDGMDGNFDIKGLSDNISVTWCRFRYFKDPLPHGEGGDSDDHRFSNLVGSGTDDKPADGTYNITYGFCWWDEGCKQRMTRCRNAELHFLNCYWNSSIADYYVGPERASCYFEGCTFAGKANSATGIWNVFNHTTNYCTFVNCTGNLPDNSSTPVAAPTYTYDQLTPATAKSYVINACGAGATLTVTTAAEVSSACDGGDTPVVPTDPVAYTGDCCINLGLGEVPSVDNGGLEDEVFRQIIITYALTQPSSKWAQGYLNLGSNNDTITFDFSNYYSVIDNVMFDVTIPNWEATKNTISYRWNKEGAYTKYTISSSALQTVSLTAPANARSFTIKRSASTGTQIQGICFQLEESIPTATVQLQNQSAAHKVLRHGQVLILRDGKTYNLLGQSL